MKEYIEIPMNKLCGISYSNPNRTPDELELSFINEISKQTGFFLSRIHIKKASKSRYSRHIDCFEFEYDGVDYILKKDILSKIK